MYTVGTSRQCDDHLAGPAAGPDLAFGQPSIGSRSARWQSACSRPAWKRPSRAAAIVTPPALWCARLRRPPGALAALYAARWNETKGAGLASRWSPSDASGGACLVGKQAERDRAFAGGIGVNRIGRLAVRDEGAGDCAARDTQRGRRSRESTTGRLKVTSTCGVSSSPLWNTEVRSLAGQPRSDPPAGERARRRAWPWRGCWPARKCRSGWECRRRASVSRSSDLRDRLLDVAVTRLLLLAPANGSRRCRARPCARRRQPLSRSGPWPRGIPPRRSRCRARTPPRAGPDSRVLSRVRSTTHVVEERSRLPGCNSAQNSPSGSAEIVLGAEPSADPLPLVQVGAAQVPLGLASPGVVPSTFEQPRNEAVMVPSK